MTPARERLRQYAVAQAADPVCSAVMKHCLDGWPERHAIEPALKPYWKVQGERTITPRPEPLMPTTLPDPWQSVAMDLFMLYGANYVLIVDYFSRYPEVIKLKSTSSKAVIEAVKAVLSRHGIPETVRSDNGPQVCKICCRLWLLAHY